MQYRRPLFSGNKAYLIISLLALFTFFAQFTFRSIDDNRLTSWENAFLNTGVLPVFLLLLAGIGSIFFIVRVFIRIRLYPVVLFFVAFCSAAIFWTEPEVIVDSSRYFTQAKHLEVYGIRYFIREWGRDIQIWTDMPLVPFLYGLVFMVFGESRMYIQIFTTTLFALTAVLTYKLGKDLWDEETGFSAGMLLIGMPYLLTQVPLMLVDVPSMFFLMLAIVTFVVAMEKGTAGSIIAAGFSIAMTFYSKYSAWLMLSVLVIFFVIFIFRETGYGNREPGSRPIGLKTCFCRLALISGISVLLIGAVFFWKYDVFREQIKLLIEYQKPGLNRWHESFISTFFFQIHPFITLAALYSAYLAVRRKDIKYLVIFWLLLLVFGMQIRRIRYIVMVFPMIALMAAYGFVLTILVSSLTIGSFIFLPFLQRMSIANLKNAGAFLNSLNETNVEVFTLDNPVMNTAVTVPILDMYTGKSISYQYPREAFIHTRETFESSLRFTWEYKNPEYYMEKRAGSEVNAIVVISSGLAHDLPGYIQQKIDVFKDSIIFRQSDHFYQYQPFVSIYYHAPSGTLSDGSP
jgi:hypothetical protein